MTTITVTERRAVSYTRGRDYGNQCADGDTLDMSAVKVVDAAFVQGFKVSAKWKTVSMKMTPKIAKQWGQIWLDVKSDYEWVKAE